jgi:hypothetical protein
LTVAALAAFSCAPEGPADDSAKEYAGNKVNVTAPDAIPAQGGTVTATVVTTLDADVPFTVSVPKAATWIKVGDITEEQREVEVGKEVNGEMIAETVTEVVRTVKFTAATANEIKVAETNVGALQSSKDVDWYKFISTGDVFSINFDLKKVTDKNYAGEGWIVTIYDGEMKEIASYSQITSLVSPKFPMHDVIYVKVEANDTYITRSPLNIPYQLTAISYVDTQWESEYNNKITKFNF